MTVQYQLNTYLLTPTVYMTLYMSRFDFFCITIILYSFISLKCVASVHNRVFRTLYAELSVYVITSYIATLEYVLHIIIQ